LDYNRGLGFGLGRFGWRRGLGRFGGGCGVLSQAAVVDPATPVCTTIRGRTFFDLQFFGFSLLHFGRHARRVCALPLSTGCPSYSAVIPQTCPQPAVIEETQEAPACPETKTVPMKTTTTTTTTTKTWRNLMPRVIKKCPQHRVIKHCMPEVLK
jgi:hypothetical protein